MIFMLLQMVFYCHTNFVMYISSKRVSGFDMAPPASALLAGAAAAAGACPIYT